MLLFKSALPIRPKCIALKIQKLLINKKRKYILERKGTQKKKGGAQRQKKEAQEERPLHGLHTEKRLNVQLYTSLKQIVWQYFEETQSAFISCTLRSWVHAIFSHYRTVSPTLGDNYASKCTSDSFPHTK